MNDEAPEELSPRAEIFRSKLIEDFQLIDMIANRGGTEPPKYYSNEITGITTQQPIAFFLHNVSHFLETARQIVNF